MSIRRIVEISNNGKSILIKLDDGEFAEFYRFGKEIYTTTSTCLSKRDLMEFKKDIKKFNWEVDKLKQIWVN